MYIIIFACFGLALSSLLNLAPEIVSPENLQILNLVLLGLWFVMLVGGFQGLVQKRRIGVIAQQLSDQNAETVAINQKLVHAEAEASHYSQELGQRQKELAVSHSNLEDCQQQLKKLQDKVAKAESQNRTLNDQLAGLETSQNRDSDSLQLLSILQNKGRFLDFVMGDVSQVPDDRMGAAARIVHQGCSKAIREYFDIQPVVSVDEGSQIEIAEQDSHRKFRIIGSKPELFPLRGRLLHRGWRTEKVDLPKRVVEKTLNQEESGIITPAEIELS